MLIVEDDEQVAVPAEMPEVDLLLTDLVMPGGRNGVQLASQALWICPGLKVLYTSGYNEATIGQDPGGIILRTPYR